ncbi:MAG: biotin/lipoyl-binding protein, partial [Campylobacterota bacterium]|nr:biotin/lipoyl-binding protein [Campylobacterota bacterium]
MMKELIILLVVALIVASYQLVNYFMMPSLSLDQLLHISVLNSPPFHVGAIIGFFYALIFIFRWFLLKPIAWMFSSSTNEDVEFVHTLYAQSNAKIQTYTIVLFSIIVVFFSTAIGWAYWAEIDELARGEGKVIPSAKIQTIQSLDGGVISEILVKEGFIVKIGQPLMKIDTTRFKASLDENTNALEDLIASKIRLEAEINIDIGKPLPKLAFNDTKLADYPEIVKIQKGMFETRFNELKSSILILENQVSQKKQELVELKSKKYQLYKSIQLIKQEMATIEKLVQRRAKSKIELISIKREHNSILGDYTATRLSIPRSQLAIKESQNKINEKVNMFQSQAAQ